jgi:hypothetical protein
MPDETRAIPWRRRLDIDDWQPLRQDALIHQVRQACLAANHGLPNYMHQAVAEIRLPQGASVSQPRVLQHAKHGIPSQRAVILDRPPAEGGGKLADDVGVAHRGLGSS